MFSRLKIKCYIFSQMAKTFTLSLSYLSTLASTHQVGLFYLLLLHSMPRLSSPQSTGGIESYNLSSSPPYKDIGRRQSFIFYFQGEHYSRLASRLG